MLTHVFFEIARQLQEVEPSGNISEEIASLDREYDFYQHIISTAVAKSTERAAMITEHKNAERRSLEKTKSDIANEITILRRLHTFDASRKIALLNKKFKKMSATVDLLTDFSKKAQQDKLEKNRLKTQLEAIKGCAQFFKSFGGLTTDLINSDTDSYNTKQLTFVEKSNPVKDHLPLEENFLSNSGIHEGKTKKRRSTTRATTTKTATTHKNKNLAANQKDVTKDITVETTTLSPASSPPPSPATSSASTRTLAQDIMQLNRADSSIYHLHERVKRWRFQLNTDSDLDIIKLFADYSEGKLSYPYAKLGPRGLKYQRDAHHVAWAQRIISGPLEKSYSFDHRYSATQSGKALVASLISGGEKRTGLIVLGIGENREIYHAKLRLFDKMDIVPKHLAKLLQLDAFAPSVVDQSVQSIQVDQEESKTCGELWQETSAVKFSLINKSIIEVKIRDTTLRSLQKSVALPEPVIIYQVYPLV